DVPYPPPHKERVRYEQEVGPMDRDSNYPMYYKKQMALSPEAAIDRMILPEGFRAELFASEPDIVNPIAMNWDEQVRLWVIESVEYPYPRSFWPDGGGKDRIVILEDTDDDGRADTFTEFADSLNIPTSLTFANGGVIVQQAPQTLFFKDTDGDDKADVREVLFEGGSQFDTHAGPSHLRYGLDNWIWGTVGYSGFEGTVGGEDHEFRMGAYRFKKDGSKLDFLHRTNNNTWGLGFREGGDAFISTANGNPSTFLPFPRRIYDNISAMEDPLTDRITGSSRIITLTNLFRQVDWVGAFTAGSGHAVYTARKYPQKYWNKRAFVMDPTMQMVGEFILNEKGTSYEARYPRNLVASDDEWFSPVVADVGPDGQVWIADWYNYIIQHNAESDRQEPTPGNAYANPLRDKRHGRIYRIVYEGSDETYGDFSLEDAGTGKLVETLSHNNLLWRKHAQRLLVEKGDEEVAPELIKLIENEDVDEVGLNVGAIHGLWTLHGLGLLDGGNKEALSAAAGALDHPSEAVRKNAVNVLPENGSSIRAILDHQMLNDQSSKVRLAALVALAEMPESEEAGSGIFNMLSDTTVTNDEWMSRAGALAAAQHAGGFLESAAGAGVEGTGVEQKGQPPESLAQIVQLVAEENPDFDQSGDDDGGSEEGELPPGVDASLEVGVTPNILEYDVEKISAKAGQTVRLVFKNTGNMEHNLLLLKPGTLQEVGGMADKMISSSEGREKGYVPDTPAVIGSTPIVQPGETYEITFEVPDEPGEYPYVCTIPGHWRSMRGVLVVEP
ncbi:MAG TPA: PVC-type heme-binding CxxCH protein, partial [Fodinibius sp.]|nr:PVC-type heme-binding CxxCH protein [Fodinibius sp.]